VTNQHQRLKAGALPITALSARSHSPSRRHTAGDCFGDDARVRSGSSTAGADLRFARPVGAIGTCEINGKDAPSVRMGIGIALRQVRTSAFCESARLNPGGSSSRSLVQSPRSDRRENLQPAPHDTSPFTNIRPRRRRE
jgi:hypothetical protein